MTTLAEIDREIEITQRDLAQLYADRRKLCPLRVYRLRQGTIAHAIHGLLAANPEGLRTRELVERTGRSRDTVRVVIAQMYAAGQITRLEVGLYALSTDASAAPPAPRS